MTRVLVLCCPFELSNPEWTLSFFLLGPIYNVVIDQSNYMCALINLSFVGNDKRGTTCHLRLEHWPHLSGLVFVFLLDHSFLEPSLNLLGFLANPTVASSVLRMQGKSELGAPFYTAHTYFKILINNFFLDGGPPTPDFLWKSITEVACGTWGSNPRRLPAPMRALPLVFWSIIRLTIYVFSDKKCYH
jgi:hypothetical protein